MSTRSETEAKAAAELKKRQDEFEIKEASKMKVNLDKAASRAHLVETIYYSQLFADPYDDNPQRMAKNCGQRLIAIRILRKAHAIDKQYVAQLVLEVFEYEKRLRKLGLAINQ